LPLSEKAEYEDLWDDDWNIIDRTVVIRKIEGLEIPSGKSSPLAFR
jgi:hypothetical protein